MKKSPSRLWMIIPCYNEETVLPITCELFLNELKDLIQKKKITEDSRILFVNDGSRDNTWNIIKDLAKSDPHYIGICQSRNRGHQNAVLAGLMTVKDICDLSITMDADLQDDINAVDEMLERYYEGNQVVYGVRSARKTDTFFKKLLRKRFFDTILASFLAFFQTFNNQYGKFLHQLL